VYTVALVLMPFFSIFADNTYVKLSKLSSNFTHLTIRFANCSQKTFEKLLSSCSQLVTINLRGCPQVRLSNLPSPLVPNFPFHPLVSLKELRVRVREAGHRPVQDSLLIPLSLLFDLCLFFPCLFVRFRYLRFRIR